MIGTRIGEAIGSLALILAVGCLGLVPAALGWASDPIPGGLAGLGAGLLGVLLTR